MTNAIKGNGSEKKRALTRLQVDLPPAVNDKLANAIIWADAMTAAEFVRKQLKNMAAISDIAAGRTNIEYICQNWDDASDIVTLQMTRSDARRQKQLTEKKVRLQIDMTPIFRATLDQVVSAMNFGTRSNCVVNLIVHGANIAKELDAGRTKVTAVCRNPRNRADHLSLLVVHP